MLEFPYGKAPLVILVLALCCGALIVVSDRAESSRRPDIIFATFTKEHADAYTPAIAEFQKQHGVTVQLQVVDQFALKGRLQAALQVGAEVPDMVELLDGTMGFFVKGPIEDVGFVDLTERLKSTGLYDKLVQNRFGKWSSRGHIFALPHDVHPTMLVYRRDLVEQLGIDVNTLSTWDEFVRVGREVTKDLNGDGVPDRYMIDLPVKQPWAVRLLLLQRGVAMFDNEGNVTFDDERAVDVVCWYVRQIIGSQRISFPCDWGQNLAKSIIDGLCLFYIAPDWRTKQFQMDVPSMGGKLAIMPLPAWEPGGIRTSTWGATGLAFTRQSRNFELAWKLAMYLYYDPEQLGPRFANVNILPPLKTAWTMPQFDEPRPFYSGMAIGREYANLAPQVPDDPAHAYQIIAEAKLLEVFTNASLYFQEKGEEGFRQYARGELKRCADRVRAQIERNVFLESEEDTGP